MPKIVYKRIENLEASCVHMKRYLLLLLAGVTSCCQLKNDDQFEIQNTKKAECYFQEELAFTSTPYDIQSFIDKKEHVVIIDVRTEKDYKAGHIPGATNIPCEKWNMFNGSETEFPGLTKNGINYVYCYALLCDLSKKASLKFASAGYPVREIKGGFAAWKESKYKVEK